MHPQIEMLHNLSIGHAIEFILTGDESEYHAMKNARNAAVDLAKLFGEVKPRTSRIFKDAEALHRAQMFAGHLKDKRSK